MDLSSKIGERTSSYRDELDRESVEAFALAVGADPAAGVPLTWVTVCRRGEFELLRRWGIELSQVLHGEQEYEYLSGLRVGMTLEYETELKKITDKKGSSGSMVFLVLETEFREVGVSPTRVVARGRSTFIVKQRDPGARLS